MPKAFSYEGVFSKGSQDTPIRVVQHAKYDFAVAYPAPETLPLDGLTEALKIALDKNGDEIARNMAYYPQVAGLPELREFVCEKLWQDRQFKVKPDQVMMTSGSSEANSLVIQAITNPGDVVITEEFVYAGTLAQLRKFGAVIVGTPLDADGIIPAALEDLIKKLTKEGRKPKYLYTIPEHQNPTGSTIPEARRREILDICHKYGMPILEDDCYVDLRFEGKVQPAFRTLDDSGIVIHVASFSKIIAPGLRLGYFTAPDDVLRRAMSFRSGGGPSQFTMYAVDSYMRLNMDKHKSNFKPMLKSKRDAMVSTLERYFSGTGATWSKPQGGCYVWLTMPKGTDLTKVQQACFDDGVGYIAGSSFAPNNNGDHCARLCFAFESPEKNREGVALLAKLFEKHGVPAMKKSGATKSAARS
ncbi:MAG: PLP-dependent aminotransferase family protein [Dehalococcoidia bacterium]|nr:PLP-dependent aminotransferase family protein [Dehalococcoidia bacterium]